MAIVFGFLAIIVIFVFFVIALYNGLIRLKNRTQESWSDIDVQLKRRYDLVPNLVETVKGYAKHEEGVFTKVTQARNMAMNASNVKDQQNAENMLSNTLKSLFAVAENYPELKANTNFANLQNQLSEIENHIQSSRRYYNGNVRDFNTKLEVFPNNIIAKQLGFKQFDFFELDDESERKNVQVKFS